MPRLIYCLHALSTHLFKLGKAPLIEDLYGKAKFTGTFFNNSQVFLVLTQYLLTTILI